MSKIVINDLTQSKELDKEALTSIHGGIGLLVPAVQKVRSAALKPRRYGGPDTKKQIIAILIG